MARNTNPGGRPKKYANAAEKAKAFRERWGAINVRCEARTKEAVKVMMAVAEFSEADIVNAAIKFYATNFDGWRSGLIFGGRMPTIQDAAYRAKREREKANQEFLQGDE